MTVKNLETYLPLRNYGGKLCRMLDILLSVDKLKVNFLICKVDLELRKAHNISKALLPLEVLTSTY